MTDKLNNPFKISELVETVNNLVDTTYDDSVVVHKAGTETITGNKTFSGTTIITGQLQSKRNNNDVRIVNQYANVTKGTAPSANQYSGFIIKDSAGTEVANIYGRINTSNMNSILLTVKDPGTGTSSKTIAIHYPANGTAYTEAPTPATDDDSTKIATTAWVKDQGYLTSYTDTKNTAGSTNTTSKIFLIGATSQAANPQTYSQDTVFVNTSGQLQTPTPGNDSNTTVAATTAFVKNVLKTSGAGLYTISKAANGYCKFNGGLIVQWGYIKANQTTLTVTLPTAFSSTNYGLGAMCNNGKAAFSNTQTASTFTLDASGGIGSTAFRWIAIGY